MTDLLTFKAIASTRNTEDGIAVEMVAMDETRHVFAIKRGAILPIIMAMQAQAQRLPSEKLGEPIYVQPFKATAVQTMIGPQGNTGLSIVLESGLRLVIPLDQSVLDLLRGAIANILQIENPPSKSSH